MCDLFPGQSAHVLMAAPEWQDSPHDLGDIELHVL